MRRTAVSSQQSAVSSQRHSAGAGLALTARLAAILALCLVTPVLAQRTEVETQAPGEQDKILKDVRLEQKLNAQVPLDLPFKDEQGKDVRLGDYFGEKPVMLMLIQYRCTMLCNEQMTVLMDNLKKLKFTPGKEFNLLIVSIDTAELPGLASDKKKNALEAYERPEGAAGWHFLTGESTSIEPLAEAVGFHYVYDKFTDQYAHPDGVMILTPQGRVARYFFRLEYPAQDLRFGLIEAADGKIGTPLDAIALLCFHWNPVTGKYALAFMKVLRLAGIATVLGLIAGIVLLKRREASGRRGPAPAVLRGES
jgi:protein SCO1/2